MDSGVRGTVFSEYFHCPKQDKLSNTGTHLYWASGRAFAGQGLLPRDEGTQVTSVRGGGRAGGGGAGGLVIYAIFKLNKPDQSTEDQEEAPAVYHVFHIIAYL